MPWLTNPRDNRMGGFTARGWGKWNSESSSNLSAVKNQPSFRLAPLFICWKENTHKGRCMCPKGTVLYTFTTKHIHLASADKHFLPVTILTSNNSVSSAQNTVTCGNCSFCLVPQFFLSVLLIWNLLRFSCRVNSLFFYILLLLTILRLRFYRGWAFLIQNTWAQKCFRFCIFFRLWNICTYIRRYLGGGIQV